MLKLLSDTFWSPRIWLPPDFTWEDLEPNDEVQYTNYRHLYLYPIPFAFAILIFRYFLEKYLFSPIGLKLGISNSKPRKAQTNHLLENAYKADSRWKHKKVSGLAKQLDWTERQVHRWLRIRKLQEKPSTLVKFCETSWRCFYYSSSFLFGLLILRAKPWFQDINHCWLNYPHHGVTNDVWWYYMISLAFYWSLIFSQFFDVKRKDFWQMFIHHIATIVLLSFSWICNLHRVGSLVLVIHDAADCLLDGTKASKYAKYDKSCTFLFCVFMVTWIVTRLIIFPYWIIYSTTMDAPNVAEKMFPAYYIFNGLLMLLLVLHIFWTNLILQLAYKTWTRGQLEGDIRSSASEDEDVDSPTKSNGKINNVANNNVVKNGTNHVSQNVVKNGTNHVSQNVVKNGTNHASNNEANYVNHNHVD